MPRITKSQIAAKLREKIKRTVRKTSAASQQNPPTSEPWSPDPFQVPLEMQVEAECHDPDEPIPPEEIKLEALEVEVEPFEQHLVAEVKPELWETVKASEGARCQFCFRLFREVGGRGAVSRRRIAFVLGMSKGELPQQNLDCCRRCKKMFDQSFEFKKACLAALARIMDCKGLANRSKACAKEEVQELPVSGEEQSGSEGEEDGTEMQLPGESVDVSSLECHICDETIDDWSVLEKHWLTHFPIFEKEPAGNVSLENSEHLTTQPDSDEASLMDPNSPNASTQPSEEDQTKPIYCSRCRKWYQTEIMFTQHESLCVGATKNPPLSEDASRKYESAKSPDQTEGTSTRNSKRRSPNLDPEIAQSVPELSTTQSKPKKIARTKAKYQTKVKKPPKAKKQPKQRNHDGEFYCRRCRKWYESEQLYEQHKPLCVKEPPPFACDRCPKRFTSQEKLTAHTNHHDRLRTVPCRREGCTAMFMNEASRYGHEKICGQDVKILCSVCGATFRSKGTLNTHMATHGEPMFPCDQCTKTFYTKKALKKHGSVHSDARNFECQTCGKGFKSYYAHRVHQRIHKEEKPYPCPICGKAFRYRCGLKAHVDRGHDSVQVQEPKEPLVANSSFAMPMSLGLSEGEY